MTAPRAVLRAAADRLAAAGVDSPRVDAELLLAHLLGCSRAQLHTVDALTPDVAAAFAASVDRRATREPLQHIVGDAAFRHVTVAVGPGVFVPRPETELLVDAVLPVLRADSEPVAVDLCSGSGALAVALADEVPTARVVAVERPGPAVAWLERNAAGCGIEVVAADVTDAGLLAPLRRGVTAVVCNPPYVPDATPVGAEVRFDPAEAVFAGPDGLVLIPAVLERAAELLRPGGLLALEHDDTHGESVPSLLRAHGGFTDVVAHRDLTGRPRYTVATSR